MLQLRRSRQSTLGGGFGRKGGIGGCTALAHNYLKNIYNEISGVVGRTGLPLNLLSGNLGGGDGGGEGAFTQGQYSFQASLSSPFLNVPADHRVYDLGAVVREEDSGAVALQHAQRLEAGRNVPETSGRECGCVTKRD
jgi:hypothetical protein